MALMLDRRLPFDTSTDYASAAPRYVSPLAHIALWLHAMFRRLICLLTGHKTILRFEPQRLALRCTECGYETPGWIIGEFTPSRVVAGMPPEKPAARDRAA
jgi:hypothetical protein